MVAAVVIFFALALATGVVFALGVGLLAVVPLVLLVAAAVWLQYRQDEGHDDETRAVQPVAVGERGGNQVGGAQSWK